MPPRRYIGKDTNPDYVRWSFESQGFRITSFDNLKSITSVCPNGHENNFSWNYWQTGAGCKQCHSRLPEQFLLDLSKAKRFNKNCGKPAQGYLERARSLFQKEGYTLLSSAYISVTTPLTFICPKGHKSQISLHNWEYGKRCGECYRNSPERDFEEIRKMFEREGYVLKSLKYTNAKTPLEFTCPHGHEHKITLDNWKKGRRCGKCYKSKIPPLIQPITYLKKENENKVSLSPEILLLIEEYKEDAKTNLFAAEESLYLKIIDVEEDIFLEIERRLGIEF